MYDKNSLPKWIEAEIRTDEKDKICKLISERENYYDKCRDAIDKNLNGYKIFTAISRELTEIRK